MSNSPRILSLRLFWRHRGRMVFFALCLAIGIGALFAIHNLLDSVNDSIAQRAKEILSADLTLSSWREFSPSHKQTIENLSQQGLRLSEMLVFTSMMRSHKLGSQPFLASVRAVEPNYPFYGELEVSPKVSQKFYQGKFCLIGRQLALRHELQIGDQLRWGQTSLEIAGIIQQAPGQFFSGTFSPVVIIPLAQAKQSELLGFASRVSRRYLVAFGPGQPQEEQAMAQLKSRLQEQLDSTHIRVQTYREAQPVLRETMRRVATFFMIVSLVTLLLGIIGMVTSMLTFFQEQLDNIGTFRCLGLTTGDIGRIYYRLCGLVGGLGGILGIVFGGVLSVVGVEVLKQVFAFPLPLVWHWENLVIALLACVLITLGMNLSAIGSLVKVTPLAILQNKQQRLYISRWALFANAMALLLGVFIYLYYSANSLMIASIFSASIVGITLVMILLIALSLALLAWLSRFAKSGGLLVFALRQGWRQLVRQRARSWIFLLALSMGMTLLTGLEIVRLSLIEEIELNEQEDTPNLFLIDVQPTQKEGVSQLIAKYTDVTSGFHPLVRSRLVRLNGEKITLTRGENLSLEEQRKNRFLRREYNLTYKSRPNPSETIIAGDFWKPGETRALISLEKDFAARLGLEVGDTMTFDIQGRKLTGQVTSLRRISWTSFSPNFFVAFPTKVLQPAPKVFIISVKIADPEKIAAFTQDLFMKYPNVSVIDAKAIVQSIGKILNQLLYGLQVVGWICLTMGVIILAGTLTMGKKERQKKISLFRALGANSWKIVCSDLVEFATIGGVTMIVVSCIAVFWSQFLAWQLDIAVSSPFYPLLKGVLLAISLPIVVGWLSNRKLYRKSAQSNWQAV